MAISAPTERKLISQTNVKTTKGGKGTDDGDGVASEEGAKKGKKSKKKLIIIVLVLLLAAGGAYYMFLMPKAKTAVVLKPGTIVSLDAQTLNLQGGHYLKIQVALVMILGNSIEETVEASNIVINDFSGKAVTDLATLEQRDKLKKEMLKELQKAYPDKIFDTFFTIFVTQ